MKAEIKAQWVAALKSGEYKQCQGTLTRVAYDGTESHCCLGVLTELAVKAGVIERAEGALSHTVSYPDVDGLQGDVTPVKVQAWSGLAVGNPSVNYNGEIEALAVLNDRDGLTFPEIAKLIDAQL